MGTNHQQVTVWVVAVGPPGSEPLPLVSTPTCSSSKMLVLLMGACCPLIYVFSVIVLFSFSSSA